LGVPGLRLRKSQQLTHRREYQRVYAARMSVVKGPLRVHGLPAQDPGGPLRFGLSVPGKVGTNVKRNRVKRLIREAIRLDQHALPRGLDLVIGVHPHDLRELGEYRELVRQAAESLAARWQRRRGRSAGEEGAGPEGAP